MYHGEQSIGNDTTNIRVLKQSQTSANIHLAVYFIPQLNMNIEQEVTK